MGRAQEAAASQIVRGEVNPHSAVEESVAELCRREGINLNVYYRPKEFLEATTDEVNKLRAKSVASVYFLGLRGSVWVNSELSQV